MASDDEQIHKLKAKYGAQGIDNALRMHPKDFSDVMSWRDEMDPQYTRLNLDYTYGGLSQRGVLSERTRLLVIIAQCAAMAEMEYLESSMRAALNSGVTPREVLEILLQTTVYVGVPKINRAGRLFHRIITALGRMDEIPKLSRRSRAAIPSAHSTPSAPPGPKQKNACRAARKC